MSSAETAPTWKQRWAELKGRLTALFEAYGPIAFVVWFAIFGLVLGGFYMAISQGFSVSLVESPEAGAGTLTVAYLATQATKPLRILATIALTPLVAKLLGRGPAEPSEG